MSSGTAMSSSATGALRLAEEQLVRGDVREALSIYRMIFDTDPSKLARRARLGELLALAHKNSDAIRVLAETATGYMRQGRQVEAVDVLNKALGLRPSDPDSLMILG